MQMHSYKASCACYTSQIKSLSNKRLDPSWSFAMFYLVKDSFALMLEMAGMWADALQVGLLSWSFHSY